MLKNFEQVQKVGQEHAEAATKTFGVISNGAAGCTEALFTLGDKPELRYASAQTALDNLGYGGLSEIRSGVLITPLSRALKSRTISCSDMSGIKTLRE
jgi:hypothetical protein